MFRMYARSKDTNHNTVRCIYGSAKFDWTKKPIWVCGSSLPTKVGIGTIRELMEEPIVWLKERWMCSANETEIFLLRKVAQWEDTLSFKKSLKNCGTHARLHLSHEMMKQKQKRFEKRKTENGA